jgi:hypothetical protein
MLVGKPTDDALGQLAQVFRHRHQHQPEQTGNLFLAASSFPTKTRTR